MAQTFVVKIPLNPAAATTVTTPIPMGTAGILLNGVSLYNSNDGNSYNNAGFWYRNAAFFEGYSFDSCVGHASVGSGTVVNGLYHHHVLPVCFSTTAAANQTKAHSPLLGFAMDGFPIYGRCICYFALGLQVIIKGLLDQSFQMMVIILL